MSKAFDPAELEEMRADLDRNPGYRGLGVVAQLHACKRGDVIDALGLDPEDYARKPQPKVTPEQRAGGWLPGLGAPHGGSVSAISVFP